MKTLQITLFSILIVIIAVLCSLLCNTPQPPPQSTHERDSLLNVLANLKPDTFWQYDTTIIERFDTIIDSILQYDIEEYAVLYDSITGDSVIVTDSTVCFTKPQLDTISKKIYEGEKCQERLTNSFAHISRQDSVIVTQSLIIGIDSLLIDSLSVEARKVPRLKRWNRRLIWGNVFQAALHILRSF